MTLQQLEYVIALDEHRHFVKAAEACNITQSTLSSMLHKLEEELDLQLFDRNSHPIKPTLAGEAIIKQARVVLFHSNQLKEMSITEHNGVSGHIRLGVTTTVAPYVIPELFSYINTIPNVTMTACELYRDRLIDMLKSAELDMAIMSLPNKDEQLLEIPLFKEKLWVYVSPNDELYKQSSIKFETMPRNRLWALKHEICFQKQLEGFCEYESERSSMFESGNIATLLRIVNANSGYTVITELHIPLIRECDRKNLRPFDEPSPERNVSLFVRSDYVRSGLLNIIADGIKTIIPHHMLDERLLKYKIKL